MRLWNNFVVVICCLHLVFSRFKTKIYIPERFPFLNNNCRKTGTMKTGTEIANCVLPLFFLFSPPLLQNNGEFGAKIKFSYLLL